MRPGRPLYDPKFKYTNSSSTDIRKLFERVKRDLKAQETATVTPITKRKKA